MTGLSESPTSNVVTVYTTFPEADVAREVSRSLVEQRFIACANVIDNATSIYRWEGAVQVESEVVVLMKTTAGRLSDLREALNRQHPYDCPALVVWPAVDGAPDYLAWVRGEVTP